MMHTMQAQEKTSQCFLYAVRTHPINVNRSQRPHGGNEPAQRKGGSVGGGAHAPLGPPNPRLCFSKPPPLPAPTSPLHPHLPSCTHLPRNPRPCVQAEYDSSQHPLRQLFFPKASTSVTPSADKTFPQPLTECASHLFYLFLGMCQHFLAGWPGPASCRCRLACA